MAILDFQRPDRVIMLEESPFRGVFQFRPLEPGYGITIGNALRRILLSSLEGYAISSVKIDGVDHEFATIAGVKEDVTQIILNLKQVRFRAKSQDIPTETVSISVVGQEVFTAGMIADFLTGFEVLNPDLVICTMNKSVQLRMDLVLRKGRGYVPSEENILPDAPFGVIPIDSIHTPIKNVMLKVDDYRVEQKTDYELLTIEILTDGSITPREALKEAANILIYHFLLFTEEDKMMLPQDDSYRREEFTEEEQALRKLLRTQLVELNLSVRALNCLKAADVNTLADLVVYGKQDLLKFRNFGKKSLAELEEVIDSLGLTFSMDIAKYKLDKD